MEDYVKNIANSFVYSDKAIKLVEDYIQQFPRVFDILATKNLNTITALDFQENNNQGGIEYLNNITEWLKQQPHTNGVPKIANSVELASETIEEVKLAVQKTVSSSFCHRKKKLIV